MAGEVSGNHYTLKATLRDPIFVEEKALSGGDVAAVRGIGIVAVVLGWNRL